MLLRVLLFVHYMLSGVRVKSGYPEWEAVARVVRPPTKPQIHVEVGQGGAPPRRARMPPHVSALPRSTISQSLAAYFLPLPSLCE